LLQPHLQVNVEGTATLLQAARNAGVQYFLYCSSTGVTFQGKDIYLGDEVHELASTVC
jgi:nucleoside-diphosphate-sugar epimerase